MNKFKCEWCMEELPESELYSYNGVLQYCGPICKDCVAHYGAEEAVKAAAMNGLPVVECPECGNPTFILHSEGITSEGKHYPIGECIICRKGGRN